MKEKGWDPRWQDPEPVGLQAPRMGDRASQQRPLIHPPQPETLSWTCGQGPRKAPPIPLRDMRAQFVPPLDGCGTVPSLPPGFPIHWVSLGLSEVALCPHRGHSWPVVWGQTLLALENKPPTLPQARGLCTVLSCLGLGLSTHENTYPIAQRGRVRQPGDRDCPDAHMDAEPRPDPLNKSLPLTGASSCGHLHTHTYICTHMHAHAHTHAQTYTHAHADRPYTVGHPTRHPAQAQTRGQCRSWEPHHGHQPGPTPSNAPGVTQQFIHTLTSSDTPHPSPGHLHTPRHAEVLPTAPRPTSDLSQHSQLWPGPSPGRGSSCPLTPREKRQVDWWATEQAGLWSQPTCPHRARCR